MAFILYDQGKKLGEISEWTITTQVPVYKNILGKTVLSVPAKDECSFVSPKPVTRKSKLTVIEDAKLKFELEVKSVVGGTVVVAAILSRAKI